MFALDTETTGKDFYHGAKPFFVTICTDKMRQTHWEWDVNPLDRQPCIPPQDVIDISNKIILSGDRIVGQNLKFDISALKTIGIPKSPHPFPFNKIEDTLIKGHLLASNKPHNLTDMAMQYLGVDILPLEKALQAMVTRARAIARRDFKSWKIAKKGNKELPSAKEECWKYDMWLPRAVAKACGLNEPQESCHHVWVHCDFGDICGGCGGYRFWTVLRDYSNADSVITIKLSEEMDRLIEVRKLGKIYRERMELVPIIWEMEQRRLPCSVSRKEELRTEFRECSDEAGAVCRNIANRFIDGETHRHTQQRAYAQYKIPESVPVDIAADMLEDKGEFIPASILRNLPRYQLTLPKSGNNNSLLEFCFRKDLLNLPTLKEGTSGKPSLDKHVVDYYLVNLPQNSAALTFVKQLAEKRKRDTALSFIESYERFMVPSAYPDFCMIAATLNQTGTDTLRMSMSNPNAQQVSKQEAVNLRYIFGPLPGREWYPCDYENLELRIPGYEGQEEAMIQLFEKPKDPPYFGSYHLLNASIVYPDLFNERVCPDCVGTGRRLKDSGDCNCTGGRVQLWEVKGGFKYKYDDTWYQWIKNAGFALIYGCQEAKFDATCKRKGGYQALRKRLPNLFKLSDYWIQYANRHGYVMTLPDKNVDPDRGYPILCSRTAWGGISPTIPLNYHVQSTAMWCTAKAMRRVRNFFQRLNAGETFLGRQWKGGYHLILQVHDELVPDMPTAPRSFTEGRGKGLPKWLYNYPIVQECRRLMELSGDDIGIPLKVASKYCPLAWSRGEAMDTGSIPADVLSAILANAV